MDEKDIAAQLYVQLIAARFARGEEPTSAEFEELAMYAMRPCAQSRALIGHETPRAVRTTLVV